MDQTQIPLLAEYSDILQVGARNMQNFNLLRELGKLRKPVLLKRGIAATIEELLLSAEYILSGGNYEVILCERGIRTFETYTRNTMDISAIPVVKKLSHLPMVADPSHGTGRRDMVAPMARAAVAAGADGLLMEVHPDPDRALERRRAVAASGAVRRADEAVAHDRAGGRPDDLGWTDALMETVAIVGVGLIGGSFGLALRKAGFDGAILGVSSEAAHRARRWSAGAIDRGATLEEAAGARGPVLSGAAHRADSRNAAPSRSAGAARRAGHRCGQHQARDRDRQRASCCGAASSWAGIRWRGRKSAARRRPMRICFAAAPMC